jgi:hypothetical protein
MGRDAFFNTGLERRFAFGIQESGDIRFFCGVNITTKDDLEREQYRHSWSYEKDARDILITLKSYIAETSLVVPDFSLFSENLQGTYELQYWLHKRSSEYIKWIGALKYYAFELGCLIYHQLKYMPELEARYDP